MKNITVSLDDETYRQARIRAAERATSVFALVRGFLQKMATEESEFARLARKERELRASLFAQGGGLDPSENLPREALYDRHALR